MRITAWPRPDFRRAVTALIASLVLLSLARLVDLPYLPGRLFGTPTVVVERIALFLVALVLVFLAYVYSIYTVWQSEGVTTPRKVFWVAALLSALAVANPDLLSHDIYSYTVYGRMVAVYGLNPYITSPSVLTRDPFLSYVDWRNLVTPYGPLWTSISAGVEALIPGRMLWHVVGFKVLGALVHLANTLLLGAVVQRLSARHTATAMAAYAWNPLTVLEFAGNGHNDSFVLLFMLLALLMYTQRHEIIGGGMLGAAVAAKITGGLFVPLYLVALIRRERSLIARIRVAVLAGLLCAAVWAVAWIPYIGGGRWELMFRLPPQSAWYLNSLPAAVYALLRGTVIGVWRLAPIYAVEVAANLTRVATTLLILVVGVALARKVRGKGDLVESWYWLFFVYLVFVGPYFWPWYATSLVLLAALSRRPFIWIVTTVLSLNAMIVYSCSDCRTYLNYSDSPTTGLTIFVLPLIALAVVLFRRSGRGKQVEGNLDYYGRI